MQAALIIPGSVVITLIHESAHALMVVSQGGSVSEFQWLPSSEGWGHIRFTFPRATTYSSVVISLAPHILSVLLVLGTALLAWRRPGLKDRAATFIYFWLFFVPLADVGFALLVWTVGGDNDVAKAFGPPGAWSVVSVVAYALAAYLLGYAVQARLYDRLKLGWLPYSVLVMTALVLMGGFLAALSGLSNRSVG